jgi:very-short-patch-repair endonuclease
MNPQHIPRPREIATARRLRSDMTIPERLLWAMLRDRRLDGLKFRRQVPIDRYVVDFYCHDPKLAVELDGLTHVGRAEDDARRSQHLEQMGVKVVRFFTNDDVLQHRTLVCEVILRESRARLSQTPSPPPFPGGRGSRRMYR